MKWFRCPWPQQHANHQGGHPALSITPTDCLLTHTSAHSHSTRCEGAGRHLHDAIHHVDPLQDHRPQGSIGSWLTEKWAGRPPRPNTKTVTRGRGSQAGGGKMTEGKQAVPCTREHRQVPKCSMCQYTFDSICRQAFTLEPPSTAKGWELRRKFAPTVGQKRKFGHYWANFHRKY